jgi:CCR4-NOT transcription complex subunit 3
MRRPERWVSIANKAQQMERFKAVEKAMKTKAYSKEGLSAAAKLDPKERAKMETCDWLNTQVDTLQTQIETLEAEGQSLQATMKKGKTDRAKSSRIAEIDHITERHTWHIAKLELIKRSLENGNLETDQVNERKDDISYYVTEGAEPGFNEDEELYDEFNLQEEEENYGMSLDNDRVSSQDTQSIQEDAPDTENRSNSLPGGKAKSVVASEGVVAARRPSTQMKSPLPALATLHNPLQTVTNGSSGSQMKPAAVPTRAPGETLKYASAAAAAAASDKNAHGIAPLPPPPESLPPPNTSISHPPLPAFAGRKASSTASPSTAHAQPATSTQASGSKPPAPTAANPPNTQTKSPASSQSSVVPSIPQPKNTESAEPVRPSASRAVSSKTPATTNAGESSKGLFPIYFRTCANVREAPPSQANGGTNGVKNAVAEDEDESIFHLPSVLQDLVQSFEATQKRATPIHSPSSQRMISSSLASCPDMLDVGAPKNYKPENRVNTPAYYPQELDPVFDDPRLYARIDPDTLFYVFYYKQGTYQQYLAAKALKDQSWRFHKQYQTWFQRHEEPKTITEEFEQGTYRFFDYESTW